MKHTIILPDLGQTTNEATIRQFLKKTGDRVRQGEPILAVSTDKVEMEVESFANGFLREWLILEGTVAAALAPLAIVTDSLEESYERPTKLDSAGERAIEKEVLSTRPKKIPAAVMAAPAARILAKELGLDITEIPGTGCESLITKADVLRWQALLKERPPVENRALQAMASTSIASKLEIPHFYVIVDVSLEHAVNWRREWNGAHGDLHISYNDLFVFCAAKSLRDTPRLNISYAEGSYQQHTAADLLVVVAKDPAMFLAPLADVSELSLMDFLESLRRAIEMKGASPAKPHLAISNLGMFGVKQFAAIIPPGCTSVLAIGAVRQEAFVREGAFANRWICSLTLSADHRVVDGVNAARFLDRMQFHLNSL